MCVCVCLCDIELKKRVISSACVGHLTPHTHPMTLTHSNTRCQHGLFPSPPWFPTAACPELINFINRHTWADAQLNTHTQVHIGMFLVLLSWQERNLPPVCVRVGVETLEMIRQGAGGWGWRGVGAGRDNNTLLVWVHDALHWTLTNNIPFREHAEVRTHTRGVHTYKTFTNRVYSESQILTFSEYPRVYSFTNAHAPSVPASR